jgi:primosomal protein N' (replication factor Y)
VAVDAAGVPGGRTFTYHRTAATRDVVVGDAVLVEYGRRQAVGVVLAERDDAPDRATKPLLAAIRAAGPLLPPIAAALAGWIASHYLAPPAMVVRAMLPPGMLEGVELVARDVPRPDHPVVTGDPAPAAPDGEPTTPDAAILAAVRAAGSDGIAVDALPGAESRAARSRRARALADAGHLALEWRLVPPGAGPRLERRVSLTGAGREAAALLAAGDRPPGRPLGRRQADLLRDLALSSPSDDPVPAPRLAERHGAAAITSLARRGWLQLSTSVRVRRPPDGLGAAARGGSMRGTAPPDASLTAAQSAVVQRVAAAIEERRHVGILLEGATASGKTAVYARAIEAALRAGRGAVVLVPEIPLATPLLDRLRHELGIDPALLHSALGDGERADEWRRIRSGEARVVVGTRIAVLAPLADPGVVVVDEEHDAAYKADRTPRLQARDVALELGRLAEAPVILGSATPDLVSVGRARQGRLERHVLSERATGAGVRVEVVDLRAELAHGNRGLLSEPLVEGLESLDREAGDRAILVLNRRGSASVVLCRDCGYVQVCPECQRPLVFHASTMALRCHHCGATAPVARRCPACASPRIRYLGGGTERVEQEVRVRLPDLRVGRLDRDVVERKGAAARVVDDLAEGRIDVLVGTSLVTKGLDIPEVTLVGVVSADVALNLPDERAAERTWQLLVQAVGRAGRGERPGRALVQTYLPDHPVIRAVADGDARALVDGELEARERYGSPPFGALVKLTVALEDRAAADEEARRMADALRARSATLATAGGGRPADVLGPVPAYVARRAGRWRFHVVLRGRDPRAVLAEDPGAPWSVDVDPESLL